MFNRSIGKNVTKNSLPTYQFSFRFSDFKLYTENRYVYSKIHLIPIYDENDIWNFSFDLNLLSCKLRSRPILTKFHKRKNTYFKIVFKTFARIFSCIMMKIATYCIWVDVKKYFHERTNEIGS